MSLFRAWDLISGRVVDETGEPIAKVLIYAMQFRDFQGTRKLVPAGGHATALGSFGHTDETGQYSLMLPPGEFVVMGKIRETWPLESDPAQVFGYAPTFYPGVIAPAEAQRVKVGVGQEAANIDFALVPARTSRVSGTVFNPGGAPLAGSRSHCRQRSWGPEGGSVYGPTNTATTGPDGRFSVNNVQAGEYVLAARSAASTDQPAHEARQMLHVAGGDIDGLVIVAGGGGTIRGQVASDDGTPVPGVDRFAGARAAAQLDVVDDRSRERGRHVRAEGSDPIGCAVDWDADRRLDAEDRRAQWAQPCRRSD